MSYIARETTNVFDGKKLRFIPSGKRYILVLNEELSEFQWEKKTEKNLYKDILAILEKYCDNIKTEKNKFRFRVLNPNALLLQLKNL